MSNSTINAGARLNAKGETARTKYHGVKIPKVIERDNRWNKTQSITVQYKVTQQLLSVQQVVPFLDS